MSRPRIIVAAALSVALVGVLAFSLLESNGGSSAAAPTDTSRFFGIVQGIRLDSQDFQTMERTGVGSDRFLLIWGDVQPTKDGPYNWGPTDALVGAFAAHGIQVVPDLWRSPPWVAGPLVAPPIDRPEDLNAWEAFLKAAVARYGPDGKYWSTDYKKRYGDDAVPLPVHSWQVWNEPNLSKYFAPGPSPTRYATLLKASHDAIKGEDPNAQIVLAGMPGYGDVNAWKFLEGLYAVPGVKDNFDAAALHPYAPDVEHLQGEIERVRKVMSDNGDQATPLWITEIGWGSAPPDRFGINQGLDGQNTMLKNSFGLILGHQKEWNVGRLFWFDWRDPSKTGVVKCSFCASAGLLRYDRTPKPAYHTFAFYTGVNSGGETGGVSGGD